MFNLNSLFLNREHSGRRYCLKSALAINAVERGDALSQVSFDHEGIKVVLTTRIVLDLQCGTDRSLPREVTAAVKCVENVESVDAEVEDLVAEATGTFLGAR